VRAHAVDASRAYDDGAANQSKCEMVPLIEGIPVSCSTPEKDNFLTIVEGDLVLLGNRPDSFAQKTHDAKYAEFKKYIEIYADTNGYAPKISLVPGGYKAELTAATPLGYKNMGNATKMTLEVRTLGKELLGIFSAEYSATVWLGYRLLQYTIPEMKIRKRIEDLVGADPGGCELQ
jgi:hypothetical protein